MKITNLERLNSMIAAHGDSDERLLWKGTVSVDGYLVVFANGRRKEANK